MGSVTRRLTSYLGPADEVNAAAATGGRQANLFEVRYRRSARRMGMKPRPQKKKCATRPILAGELGVPGGEKARKRLATNKRRRRMRSNVERTIRAMGGVS
jgi:hypothetical protein